MGLIPCRGGAVRAALASATHRYGWMDGWCQGEARGWRAGLPMASGLRFGRWLCGPFLRARVCGTIFTL